MAAGLPGMVRPRVLPDPYAALRDQLENREARFLAQLRALVFDNPGHPYHTMFELAGCAFADVEAGLRRDGLEATLAALQKGGVYLLHDELKGRQPIVRQGREIPATPASFLKAGAGGAWVSRSGGSRSAGTPTPQNTRYRSYRNCYEDLMAHEHAWAEREAALLLPILPAPYGFTRSANMARVGAPPRRWFAVGGQDLGTVRPYQWATRFLAAESRLLGAHVPQPEYLPDGDFTPVLGFLREALDRRGKALLWGIVSQCVRVAAAALERDMRLDGVDFVVGGETLSPAKRELIEQAGGRVFPTYIASEIGTIGYACRQMEGNCVHAFTDNAAVIGVERAAPLTEARVNSLHFTTLLPENPRLLINAEMDDHGTVGPARCDCTFSRAGFHVQIDNIYSFSKLTGYGTTLVGGDLLQVLEEILPRRFQGAPTDFQLIEREARKQTELVLRVHPRLARADSAEVERVFLDEVRRMYGGSLTVREWTHGRAFRVEREAPAATPSGKILALHLLGGDAGDRSPSKIRRSPQ